MARIDELLAQVADHRLRDQLARAVSDLRRKKKYGLVYEEHVPESVVLASDVGVRPGNVVLRRRHAADATRYVVEAVHGDQAKIAAGDVTLEAHIDDLLVIKPFGEPVFPVLRTADDPEIGSPERPFHAVINGENFHALQLLRYAYPGQVDLIYIDPPYNTGAADWKYNNDYVDGNDSWRHSKWLSFMEKRLKLARALLKPDSVLIVTIDEHEVSNLGVLLHQTFRDARIQMVTIVTNTAGSTSPGLFSRAEEYAYFCFFGSAGPAPMESDLLADSKPTAQYWFPLFRSRGLNDRPSKRKNLVYPVAVDPETQRVIGYGRSLKDREDAGEVSGDLDKWMPDPRETVNGHQAVWPLLDTGEMTTWQISGQALMKLVDEGFVRARRPRKAGSPRPWTLAYVKTGNRRKVASGEVAVLGREPCGALILAGGARDTIPKTTWKIAAHDARLYGTTMLRSLLGSTTFNYPKSPYAVRDTLQTILAPNPTALVVDFFAGSGTTMQAVAMLNAMDGGSRRSILVTNNEVPTSEVPALNAEGLFTGDPGFEARGICRSVTNPRVRAVVTGRRPDGEPVEGTYLDGSELSDGTEENVAFFELAYEDPDSIAVGEKFEDVLPVLWLAAGAIGDPTGMKVDDHWFLCEGIPLAVLLDEDRSRDFFAALDDRPDVTHVWLVTDSEAAFARMRPRVPGDRHVGMLYRDYLRTFRRIAQVTK